MLDIKVVSRHGDSPAIHANIVARHMWIFPHSTKQMSLMQFSGEINFFGKISRHVISPHGRERAKVLRGSPRTGLAPLLPKTKAA
ncbi:hypothetical protein [Janthinobacterium sp. GW458P]|uniref:hypothetical protein n=1 Tax=Janthinobacterium sp. GW458P TaxID=1981504 RepID=UPI001123E419|nr:hypothetical protein [Janthinobacterium sp. GW458P]MBE3027295.1 hypothetical protein [Janthinobacterium sp. GW458P]